MKPNELIRSIQRMRDLPPLICLIVVCAVSLFFVPWWATLILFAIGYCVLGYLTYQHAIKTVRIMTGMTYPNAQRLYRAAITGDWSKIRDDELSLQQKAAWGSKLQTQLATVIILERTRRKTEEERRKIEEEMQKEFQRCLKEEQAHGTDSKSEKDSTENKAEDRSKIFDQIFGGDQ